MNATNIPPPPADEVWVSGSTLSIVEEMLRAIGDDYNLTVWLNGVEIHTATVAEGDTEGEDGYPKA